MPMVVQPLRDPLHTHDAAVATARPVQVEDQAHDGGVLGMNLELLFFSAAAPFGEDGAIPEWGDTAAVKTLSRVLSQGALHMF
ncbi:hypothetical protein V6Z72_20945 [Cereibacter sphaeroides]|uniref:hypothetical protein n=1 Tax=Cereibacter sphaeroides TaxID=1063 RepID=UPI0039904450